VYSAITYRQTETVEDLKKILDLQQRNLPAAISAHELKSEGFVTVHHDLKLLQRMHKIHPHSVAVDQDHIVGYSLVMTADLAEDIPILIPLFDQIEALRSRYPGSYFVMGQVCIDKSYRKRGIFRSLYNHLFDHTRSAFDHCFTEIDAKNERSLGAHYAVGFKDALVYPADGHTWHLVHIEL